MKVGITVRCLLCGRTKQPHGRSASVLILYCNDECPGYNQDPKPGCLWPNESGADFGYDHCSNATKEIEA